MATSKKTKPLYKIILAILTCLVIIIYWFSNITEGVYYKSYSPDGQYSRYASKDKYFNLKLPFDNEPGGKVHVYDELENKLVGSHSIDMISNINEMDWSEESLTQRGHFSINLPREINVKIINEYVKSIPVKDSWNLFFQGKHYIVSEVSQRRLVVSNNSGETILQDIQHISQINNGFQVLNKNTKIEYYDAELNKLTKPPEQITKDYGICGNVTTYSLKIDETEKYFILKKAIGHTNYNFLKL